ncbi:hypothetical protein ACFX15_039753 [Malus domestica]
MGKPTVLLLTRAFLRSQNEEKLTLPKQAHSNRSAQYYNMHTEFFRAKHYQVLHYHRSEILRCKRRRLRRMETAVAVGPRPTCGGRCHAAQLGWAVMSSRKACAGNSFTMPFKAFAVASLYIGSIATAGVAGIRKVSFPFLALSFLGVYQIIFIGNSSFGSIAICYTVLLV